MEVELTGAAEISFDQRFCGQIVDCTACPSDGGGREGETRGRGRWRLGQEVKQRGGRRLLLKVIGKPSHKKDALVD